MKIENRLYMSAGVSIVLVIVLVVAVAISTDRTAHEMVERRRRISKLGASETERRERT